MIHLTPMILVLALGVERPPPRVDPQAETRSTRERPSLTGPAAATRDIREFGASEDVDDNSAAIQAAVDAAAEAGGGTILVPPGTFRYTRGLAMRDRVTLTGQGPQSVLFYDPSPRTDICTRFAVMFAGRYPDYPSVRPMCDEHPPALIRTRPASVGSSELVASPSGGFANISAGDWIILAEGRRPKWNTKIQYVRVIAKHGDVLTLERPLDFSFDGSSEADAAFGVKRIVPVQDAWLENLTMKTGPGAVFGGFGCGLAVRGGVRSVVLDPVMDPATRVAPHPYANDVHQFEISANVFLRGNFGGFNRSSYSRFVHNLLPSVNDSDQEYGEGASFDVIAYNHFAGHTGKNPVIGIGRSFFLDVSHNVFSNVERNSAVKVVGGCHGTIADNTFNNVRAFAISIGSSDGVARGNVTRDWLVTGNRILLRPGLANTHEFPAIAVYAHPDVEDVVVSQNWVDHPIKLGSGMRGVDRRTILVYGNVGPGVVDDDGPAELTKGPATAPRADERTTDDELRALRARVDALEAKLRSPQRRKPYKP